jgi:pyridoxine/pyridoxamine 5'-phosphate oxidase
MNVAFMSYSDRTNRPFTQTRSSPAVPTDLPLSRDNAAAAAADFFTHDDPLVLFDLWMADAVAAEPNDPNAMAVATVDDTGLPDVRILLLKGADRRGFVFFTNFESAKGRELGATPKAALCFHWKSIRRQVRVRGPVAPVSAAEADEYFASRPRDSQIGAWASRQSRPERKTLVLTGASRGIGHATVKRFSSPAGGSSPARATPSPRTARGRRGRRTTSRSTSPIRKIPSAPSARCASG